MKEPKPIHDPAEKRTNRRLLWLVLVAAMAWGLMLSVGAFLQDSVRGAIVFSVVLVFMGLWALALLRFERRRRD